MKITTVGIDLAKNVIQVHGVDGRGKAALKKQLKRDQVAPFFANLAPCVIGVEACSGAHFWARKLQLFGHTVKLMAPQFVKPHVKTNKNDIADAEAILARRWADPTCALYPSRMTSSRRCWRSTARAKDS
jgi:transposase